MKNWSEGSGELEEAKEDLYFYPAPRTRPPALRPGMKHYGEAPDGARPPSPSATSRRKLRIGPWKRNDEVTRKKNARLMWMDRTYKGDREHYVDKHVLGSRDVLLERNRFPYQLPPGAEHWTIWSRKAMDHEELCSYVEEPGWTRGSRTRWSHGTMTTTGADGPSTSGTSTSTSRVEAASHPC
ncbi:unnamed protein product [Effrenium voratum]|nr:unnamed protein product [Effrenium voratum]